jgi:3-methylcrotonyl-CoA carboxylase alpha subunit
MFRSLLIANRGEIACRVIRTARRLGLRSIAVYSEADARALHVELADEAYLLGPAPARESYLAIDRVLDAARRSGADAIHPGYGFLSEIGEFADACAAAGLVFVGPPAAAIRAMGSKAAAKALMERSGVPLVPGYHGTDQDNATLRREADAIGYPVLVKASAGGGGKGMRLAATQSDLGAAIAEAKGEALAAFGDDTVLLERYLAAPRHIEIQVFADAHGNVVSLFERDCSIQRRHQKIVEEAPAPDIDPARRARMGDAACAAARAVGYIGAGTIEFMADAQGFYFMEMNTRLQVEHPVTEAITGLDLVEWQLRVAAGEVLPKRQDELSIAGHAIEARIYAEDPARDFAPSIGTLRHLRAPVEDAQVRLDTAVRAGDAISIHYDPMIAKLIIHAATRDAALQRLTAALRDYEIVGVQTNLPLLRALAAHPAFRAGEIDTGFIARHAEALLAPSAAPPRPALAAAVLRLLADGREAARAHAALSGDPHSPWMLATAWRMNGDGYQDVVLRAGEQTMTLRAHPRGDGAMHLDLPDGAAEITHRAGPDGTLLLALDGATVRARTLRYGDEIAVLIDGAAHTLHVVDPLAPARDEAAGADRVTAPMPGRVVQVAAAGTTVARGDVLVVLEAMKVQMRLPAPRGGVIASVLCAVGDLVQDGAELVTFADDAA